MNFYKLEEKNRIELLNNDLSKINHSGVPIDIMSSIFSRADKSLKVNDIHCVLWTEDVKFFQGVVKKAKISFHLGLETGLDVLLIGEKKVFYQIVNTELLMSLDREKITNYVSSYYSKFKNNSDVVSVINWLDGGEVGVSSLTLCKHLYPNVEHNKYKEKNRDSHPMDYDDFSRCVKLVNSIPGSREKLKNISISKEWDALIKNWNEIESSMLSIDSVVKKQGAELLYQCINSSATSKNKM